MDDSLQPKPQERLQLLGGEHKRGSTGKEQKYHLDSQPLRARATCERCRACPPNFLTPEVPACARTLRSLGIKVP